jgi:imidazolonepropionase-like amidohydrolase
MTLESAAKAIRIDKSFGSIQQGKVADLLILNADPLANIKNTRDIYQVWKAGVKVSDGPLLLHLFACSHKFALLDAFL